MTPASLAEQTIGDEPARSRPVTALVLLGVAAVVVIATLASLGVWQVRRLAWKEALIARVDARVHAPPSPVPSPASWTEVTADEYRHVRAVGAFDNGRETAVQAVTALGPGFWILTPLNTASDGTILVNRGFVPAERRDPAARPDAQPVGPVTISGLLRISEPKGGFLRSNDPADNHWYSRDVAAIAQARGLANVAPYFIDADATPGALDDAPVGGLTVIDFPNNHLAYALTWFSMAALLAGATVWAARDEWRRRSVRPSLRAPPAE